PVGIWKLEDEPVGQYAGAPPDDDLAVRYRLLADAELGHPPAERNKRPESKLEKVLVVTIRLLEQVWGEKHTLAPYDLAQGLHRPARSRSLIATSRSVAAARSCPVGPRGSNGSAR